MFLLGEEGRMVKRLVPLTFAVVALIVLVGFSGVGSSDQLYACLPSCSGVVDKKPCEVFVVEIAFKNTGTSEDMWSVNIAFEGELWAWKGTAQMLTLGAGGKKTLVWNGSVPANASVGSVARLVVYYNGSFMPLNWWIHVISGAELSVSSSTAR